MQATTNTLTSSAGGQTAASLPMRGPITPSTPSPSVGDQTAASLAVPESTTPATPSPSIGDQAAASLAVRQRALTLRSDARASLALMGKWPDLRQPSHRSVYEAYLELGDCSAEVRIASEEMSGEADLTAGYIAEVTKGLDGVEERIREVTGRANSLMQGHDNETRASGATALESDELTHGSEG